LAVKSCLPTSVVQLHYRSKHATNNNNIHRTITCKHYMLNTITQMINCQLMQWFVSKTDWRQKQNMAVSFCCTTRTGNVC